MPRVGSHSSGGSFSHSRGSSSSSSSRSSYSSSSSGSSYSGGGNHYHGSGPYFHTSFEGGGQGGIFVILFMMMFVFLTFALPFWISFGEANSRYSEELTILKNDYTYYQELAENETPILATAISYRSYQIYKDTTYYYITFEIPKNASPYFNTPEKFETTATYTISEAKQIINIGILSVCTNGEDAIQSSFNLKTDKEYAYKAKELKDNYDFSSFTPAFFLTLIGVGFGAVAVILIVKQHKKKQQNVKNSTNSTNPTIENSNNSETVTYCSYCGSKLKSNETKCPDCGARARK